MGALLLLLISIRLELGALAVIGTRLVRGPEWSVALPITLTAIALAATWHRALLGG